MKKADVNVVVQLGYPFHVGTAENGEGSITVTLPNNTTVNSGDSGAAAYDTVLTVTAAGGTLLGILVSGDGLEVIQDAVNEEQFYSPDELIPVEDNTFAFRMPSQEITITPVFGIQFSVAWGSNDTVGRVYYYTDYDETPTSSMVEAPYTLSGDGTGLYFAPPPSEDWPNGGVILYPAEGSANVTSITVQDGDGGTIATLTDEGGYGLFMSDLPSSYRVYIVNFST
jgi:hypothetical protein